MLSLDEAITHAREKAEEMYLQGMLCHANPNDDELDGCIECAKEHEQLAEWLEELKANKVTSAEVYEQGYNRGYSKAIDDFVNEIKSFQDQDEPLYNIILDEIAEQLKVGE